MHRTLLTALALLTAASTHAAHYKVFLLGGQSNMWGTGAPTSQLPLALQSPQDDVLFYHNSSTALTTLRPGTTQDFGPEVTFGRDLADAFPADNFCLIKYAVGGSDLSGAWDPTTGTVYSSFRTKVADGLAALTAVGHTYEIVGMLWTQGERDARVGRSTAEYEADLIEFIADIRTRYGANLPFFLNRLSIAQTDIPNITPVRTAQENVAAADALAFLIDSDGLSVSSADNLHYDAPGLIALGEAFAQSYVNFITPDETAPEIDNLTPAHATPQVDPWTNLTITFNEQVIFGSGNILLRQSGGALVESFNVASPPAGLTLSGATVTINPTANLAAATGYYVEIPATAIEDLAGNSFAGFSGSSTWSFTVVSAPLAATATASTFINGNTAPSKTIDNSGMTGDVHGSGTQQSWISTDTDNLANEWIQWDLGATHILDRIQVWNYNDSSRFDSGIRKLDIYVSALTNPGAPEGAGAADWTQIGTDVTLPIAPGVGTYTGFDLVTETGISLPATAIRWIRFEANSSYWDNSSPGNGLGPNQAGLSEIRFYEAAAAPPNTFADWIGGYTGLNGLTTFGDDADGDGQKNGVENYFGTHPGEFSQGLVSGTVTGSSMTFTHPLNDTPASNLSASYRWSKDLAGFHGGGVEFEGSTVSFSQSAPVDGMVTVTANITGTELDRLFVDIQVTEN